MHVVSFKTSFCSSSPAATCVYEVLEEHAKLTKCLSHATVREQGNFSALVTSHLPGQQESYGARQEGAGVALSIASANKS